jgi:phosphotransferase system IIB component
MLQAPDKLRGAKVQIACFTHLRVMAHTFQAFDNLSCNTLTFTQIASLSGNSLKFIFDIKTVQLSKFMKTSVSQYKKGCSSDISVCEGFFGRVQKM